jgi:hypothetical protein
MFLLPLAKIAEKSSLRTVLIVPFVLQIVATVGLVGYLSFRNGQKATQELATQLRTESTLRIQQHLRNALQESRRVNQINVDAIELGNLNHNDFSILLRHFWRQIQAFDYVSDIYLGTLQGKLVGVERQDNGAFVARVTETFPKRNFYALDNQGNRSQLLKIEPEFDSRTRPWYKKAVKPGKPRLPKISGNLI